MVVVARSRPLLPVAYFSFLPVTFLFACVCVTGAATVKMRFLCTTSRNLSRTCLTRSSIVPASSSFAVRRSLHSNPPQSSSSSTAIFPGSTAHSALHPPRHASTSIFKPLDTFAPRHNGPRANDAEEMLKVLGYNSMDEFVSQTVPSNIRIKELNDKDIPPLSELEFLRRAERLAEKNQPIKSYIGMGYHNAIVPPVIQRNVFENPAWYTAYTPYSPEQSQGEFC